MSIKVNIARYRINPLGYLIAFFITLSIKLYNGDQYTVYRDGEIVVEGVYVIKNNRLYITDKKGPYACPENPNATYRWVINDKD